MSMKKEINNILSKLHFFFRIQISSSYNIHNNWNFIIRTSSWETSNLIYIHWTFLWYKHCAIWHSCIIDMQFFTEDVFEWSLWKTDTSGVQKMCKAHKQIVFTDANKEIHWNNTNRKLLIHINVCNHITQIIDC